MKIILDKCKSYDIIIYAFGSIAQLGEHLPYKQRVTGSSPVVPTITKAEQSALGTMAR